MKQIPWLVLLALLFISCSGSKTAQNVDSESGDIELSDADEFLDTSSPISDEATADMGFEEAMPNDGVIETNDSLAEATPFEPVAEPAMDTMNSMTDSAPDFSSSSSSMGGEKIYTVKANETLMLIAFNIYGDYEKWRELAAYNRDTLNGSTNISTGMQLKYLAPAQEFVWNPQGSPYLIRTGDSLSGISGKVYGSISKWRSIWDNNRPLIKDPNRIFAGFTIYYLESGRDVAESL